MTSHTQISEIWSAWHYCELDVQCRQKQFLFSALWKLNWLGFFNVFLWQKHQLYL